MKTLPVKQLMEAVLATVTHDEDVIDRVFMSIEANAEWHHDYDEMCAEFTKHVVNTMGGHRIAQALGGVGVRQVPANCAVIESYSKLEFHG